MSTAPETDTLRSSAVDDYAKAIYALEHRAAKPVTTTALAARLGVTAEDHGLPHQRRALSAAAYLVTVAITGMNVFLIYQQFAG
jgi:hypothetical protein